jgi:hypothetical protein
MMTERTHTASNDPRLLAPTQVHVLIPFCVQGKRVEAGQTVTLPYHDARSLAAIGRCELVN